jgi:hypothetical protein
VRFIEINEIEEWCRERGVGLAPDGALLPDPTLSHSNRASYAEGRKSGREAGVAMACARALGRWDEALLWIRGWGVWGSGENWPAYYGLRGAQHERRSLEKAPGHLFEADERELFIRFLAEVMENAWDTDVLIVPKIKRIQVSHDEWVELQSTTPTEFSPVAV